MTNQSKSRESLEGETARPESGQSKNKSESPYFTLMFNQQADSSFASTIVGEKPKGGRILYPPHNGMTDRLRECFEFIEMPFSYGATYTQAGTVKIIEWDISEKDRFNRSKALLWTLVNGDTPVVCVQVCDPYYRNCQFYFLQVETLLNALHKLAYLEIIELTTDQVNVIIEKEI